MLNLNNYGIVTGRLTTDPFIYQNNDGSRKIRITLAVSDNYKNTDGKRSTQFLPLEAFIPVDRKLGVFDMIHAGDKISAAYTVKNNNYTDKNTNKMVYGLVLQIERISFEESKTTTTARQAAKAIGKNSSGKRKSTSKKTA
ncbi:MULTISPECIES: single-stranded DNA-binding protein [unclassified Blautia]|uniref:single-stranded DNA-binding protein n=1 Tax=unclassified Blautia TaxID=2648079 RepID=UPI003F8C94E3